MLPKHFVLFSAFGLTPLVSHAQVQSQDTYKFAATDDTWQVFTDLKAWESSDFIPVRKIEGDWASEFSPKAGNNVSLRRNRVELGVMRNHWILNLEVREEASLNASDQTLAFVRVYKLGQRPSQPTSYVLNAGLDSWSAAGARVGYKFDLGDEKKIRLLISAAYYADPQYRRAGATGTISYASAEQYSFQASESDVNSRYQYLYRQYEPSAKGYSVSAAAEWQLTPVFKLSYQGDDLMNRFQWNNLPEVNQTINSQVVQYDSSGYINYQPLLQGINRQVSRSISIGSTNSIAASYQWDLWQVSAQALRFSGVTIPTLAVARDLGNGKLTTSWDTRFHSMGLGWQCGKLSLQAESDSLSFSRAKVLGVGVHYLQQF